MSTEPSVGWDFDPPQEEDEEGEGSEEDLDRGQSPERELDDLGEIAPGTSFVYFRPWDIENDNEKTTYESRGVLHAVTTPSDESLVGNYLSSNRGSEDSMEAQDHELQDAALEVVFEPLFEIVSLTGAAVSGFLTIASLIAGGYPLAVAFAVATAFFIYAYSHGLE